MQARRPNPTRRGTRGPHGRVAPDRSARRGLAPLELVLALPLLLFVMALIIDFGAVGGWRVRAQIETRHAAWRDLRVRTGTGNPPSWFWPGNTPLNSGNGNAVAPEIPVWHGLTDVNLVLGPAIVDPESGLTIRVPRQLEMANGTRTGSTTLQRQVPLLAGALPSGGTVEFAVSQDVFDRRWEYHDLGYGSNDQRRADLWWALDTNQFDRDLLDLRQRVQDVQQRMQSLPTNPYLAVLDDDDEFQQYTGNSPEFHPRWQVMPFEDDAAVLRGDPRYLNLRTQITKLPGHMARSFMGLYQGEIARLQQLQPPPAQQIAALQTLLAQVTRFHNSLPPRNR